MDLWMLKPGHKVRMRDGSVARVLAETEDGASIKVEYLEPGGTPLQVDVEDMVDKQEVEVLLGVAHLQTWEDRVTVVVHHIPESGDSEAGYEAVTMKGVPYGVAVTGYDSGSAEAALNNLLDGLRAFGFEGRVAVEDATRFGAVDRYEV